MFVHAQKALPPRPDGRRETKPTMLPTVRHHPPSMPSDGALLSPLRAVRKPLRVAAVASTTPPLFAHSINPIRPADKASGGHPARAIRRGRSNAMTSASSAASGPTFRSGVFLRLAARFAVPPPRADAKRAESVRAAWVRGVDALFEVRSCLTRLTPQTNKVVREAGRPRGLPVAARHDLDRARSALERDPRPC